MNKRKTTFEDLPVLIHTALRKVCDSTITSVAYLLVHRLNGEEWVGFLRRITGLAETPTPNAAQFRAALAALRDDLPDDQGERLLVLVFSLFDDGDLEGALAYV